MSNEPEMVERVARAICAADGSDPEANNQYVPPYSKEREAMKNWQAYIDLARAAIEAMREPTPFMVAETLPMIGMHCDPKTNRLAEMALHRLEPKYFQMESHRNGLDAARSVIGDYYSMIDAALHGDRV